MPLKRAEVQVETVGWRRKLLPGIQKSSFPVVIPLCLLFALDSFASSLTPQYVNFVYSAVNEKLTECS